MLLDDKAELSERMVRLIAEKADQADVGVFHRWALMRHWHVHNNISFERMLDRPIRTSCTRAIQARNGSPEGFAIRL